jgi:exodeoxyribonuclease VII small subunit
MSDTLSPVETYEQLFSRLLAVVERLESGELPLDEALALYEQGSQLTQACQQLLEQAELRVQMLQAASE